MSAVTVGPRWTIRWLLGIVLLQAVTLLLAASAWWQPSYTEILIELGISGSWVICGYAATRVASTSRTGTLMLLWASLDLFSDQFGGYGWVGNSPVLATLTMAGRTVSFVQIVLAIHIAVTFPSGRPVDRLNRAALTGIWIIGAMATIATMATSLTPAEYAFCQTRTCRPNIV
jgi:hypothetical protein